jgi:hypothetical protein
MASVYGRLGFDFDANNTGVLSLSDDAVEHLNTAPNFLPYEWQKTDLANADTAGYYKNPAANVCISMFETANSIFKTTANVGFLYAGAERSVLLNSANQFPYRQSALGYGKFLIYLTYQTDGIANTSPAIGSFTSLFVNDQLESNNTILINDFITLNNSIDMTGNSTLSGAAVNVIISHIDTANNLISTRKNHDVQFFRNSAQVLNDFSDVAEFSNMGQLDTNLVDKYIGSDKLLTRLNS